MDLKQLKQRLDKLAEELKNKDKEFLAIRLKSLISAFPFNEYEYMLIFLRDKDIITFEEYEKLRDSYTSSNRYLNLYNIAPRIFGQVWAEEHLMSTDSRYQKPNKKLDPQYTGEYDLWLDGIKLEVKASRATNTKKTGRPCNESIAL